MDSLREQARRAIVSNLRALEGGSLEERAGRFWDIPAKVRIAERIHDEERARSIAEARAAGLSSAHNNRFDALRHARASRRIAETAGPVFADLAGVGHEAVNVVDQLLPALRAQGLGGPYDPDNGPTPGEVIDEIRMDLHNNAAGRAAARDGRPIDPERLRTEPAPSRVSPLYRSPPDSRTGLPPR